MKKWGLLCTSILLLGLLFVYKNDEFKITKGIDGSKGETYEVILTTDDIYEGNLLLVNHDYHIQTNHKPTDIVNLFEENSNPVFRLKNSDIHFSREIILKFTEMVQAAREDGIENFIINSGYRNFAEQDELYREMGAAFAMPPGSSEHNLGLALDVGSTEMKMNIAPEGKWIEEHAWNYGFVLRYPEDKTEITGIQYEPWHIRYVGLPHSAIMQEKNFVLEEYLAYLKEQKTLTFRLNGKEYLISYYPLSEATTIEVPDNRDYEFSGNNIDGVIVTVF